MHLRPRPQMFLLTLFCSLFVTSLIAQEARLLRQPNLGTDRIAFTYGADVWTAEMNGQDVRRITSTAAVESTPHFSPDGKWLAFSSNRDGGTSVYVVDAMGGMPTRLTWHPSGGSVRGWTPDGKSILFASSRNSAPVGFNRLWTIPATGGTAVEITRQWGFDGSYSPNGKQIALDKMSRWDTEWRAYRGGQNTPLIVLDIATNEEVLIPNEKTTDVQPNCS